MGKAKAGDGRDRAHARGREDRKPPTDLRPSPAITSSYHEKLHTFQTLKPGMREGGGGVFVQNGFS